MKLFGMLGSLRSSAARLARDERGSATIWNIFWFPWFAIMGGLAIDSTNAYRHETILQSTADVSALAAAWELPEDYLGVPWTADGYPAVRDMALDYALRNMSMDIHGEYFLKDEDVFIGHFDSASRTFTDGECATYHLDPCPDLETIRGG